MKLENPAPAEQPVESSASTPGWRFFTAGGFDQVRLDRGTDLLNLDQLDQKLWVALSCPVQGLEFDVRTLILLDTDGDGHIRAPELIGAIRWAALHLKNPEPLISGGALDLADIAGNSEDGARLLSTAYHVLASLGKAGTQFISVEDVSDSARIFAGMAFNGDGVITEAACSEALKPVLADIITCLGGVRDRSGDTGIDQTLADRFFTDAQAWLDWENQPQGKPDLLPLAADTPAAHAVFASLKAKIDDYFTRCRLAAFDPRAAELLNGNADDLRTLGGRMLDNAALDLDNFPIAWVAADGSIPLAQGANPAWSDALDTLRRLVVTPLLGPRDRLNAEDWSSICACFAPFSAWQAARPQTPVDKLGLPRLAALLDGGFQPEINDLIARDAALAAEADAIESLERLVRYVRDLGKLANNFVAFRDFYTRSEKAIFQAGTLYLDGRSCDLCLKVLDLGRHATLPALSGVYLAYCDCIRGSEKMTIVAAFTAGDADQLMVGRNGIFYDRQGRDWDATIIRIVDHPISIRQAFWTPYRKASRLLAEQLQKWATARAKDSDNLAANAIGKIEKPAEAGKPGTPTAFDAARFAGIFAAIGLAIGAIGTALASVLSSFLSLKVWQMPLALAGLVLFISGPSIAMAYFKLRNRNLGPLLDANGWAVNARARINIPFGTSLTQLASLPEGAVRALGDPYAEKPSRWKLYLALALIVGTLLAFIGTSLAAKP